LVTYKGKPERLLMTGFKFKGVQQSKRKERKYENNKASSK
jgi:hypothetical protein